MTRAVEFAGNRRATGVAAALAAAAVLLSAVLAGGCATTVEVGEAFGDATLTARVKTALLNDAEIGTRRIDVETIQGIVTLSGEVRSSQEERRALDVARSIEGVREVRSALRIAPAAP